VTIIVGAISRHGGALPSWLRAALVSNLSRHPGDVAEIFGNDDWFLAKVDIGIAGGGGSLGADAGALVMAGEALLAGTADAGRRDRCWDRDVLYRDLCTDAGVALPTATGTFCAAFYTPHGHRLTLISDKLSIRPIYYVVTPEFAAFTSALRIFETAGLTTEGIDERGNYQVCTFGVPLGNRTCYQGIRAIGPGEIVHITRDAERHESYFRWDRLPRNDRSEAEICDALTVAFDRALAKRLRGDKVALSFLSGGLDSRTIVAALRNRGIEVVTVNFAPPKTQDRHFAQLAAQVLGTRHHQLEVPMSVAADIYRQTQLSDWVRSLPESAVRPERPFCIWSGDGGSMGMGHIYQDIPTVAAFESGDIDAGIREFFRYNRIHGASNSAMTPTFRERSRQWHIEGMREEIAAMDRPVDGRTPYLFLLFNDQRRHMAKHFEQIDLHRFEFLMPFYDADLLETVVRSPPQPFLLHAIYHQWLARMSPAAVSVPWQTYPDHVPCPIRSDVELRYQWGDYFGRAEDRRLARNQGRAAAKRFFGGSFPGHLISRPSYAAAILTCLAGSSSYSHVVRVGDTFTRSWQQYRSSAANRRK
jgi:hypothetical protein